MRKQTTRGKKFSTAVFHPVVGARAHRVHSSAPVRRRRRLISISNRCLHSDLQTRKKRSLTHLTKRGHQTFFFFFFIVFGYPFFFLILFHTSHLTLLLFLNIYTLSRTRFFLSRVGWKKISYSYSLKLVLHYNSLEKRTIRVRRYDAKKKGSRTREKERERERAIFQIGLNARAPEKTTTRSSLNYSPGLAATAATTTTTLSCLYSVVDAPPPTLRIILYYYKAASTPTLTYERTQCSRMFAEHDVFDELANKSPIRRVSVF